MKRRVGRRDLRRIRRRRTTISGPATYGICWRGPSRRRVLGEQVPTRPGPYWTCNVQSATMRSESWFREVDWRQITIGQCLVSLAEPSCSASRSNLTRPRR